MKRGITILFVLFIQCFGTIFPGISNNLISNNGQFSETGTIQLKLDELRAFLHSGELAEAEPVYSWLNNITLQDTGYDTIIFSEIDYYIGTYLLFTNRHDMANKRFNSAIRFRESVGIKDQIYLNAYSNLGVSLYKKGDFRSALEVYESLMESARIHAVGYDPEELTYFINMSASCIRMQDYEKARSVSEAGIEIADSLGAKAGFEDRVLLYLNLSVTYSKINDYTSALLYLNRAWDMVLRNPMISLRVKISVIYAITTVHIKQGNDEAARKIFLESYPWAINDSSEEAFYFINYYGEFLAKNNDSGEFLKLMYSELERLADNHGVMSRLYNEVLSRYCKLSGHYGFGTIEALALIETQALPYCNQFPDDHYLIRDIYESYALTLQRVGRYEESLSAIQMALFPTTLNDPPLFSDPDPLLFVPDRKGLELLQGKVDILDDLYTSTRDTSYLGMAILTNKLLISLIEKVRIDIGEEESRILLGDNFVEVYTSIIRDLQSMYLISGQEKYFSTAFEYAERSKAASLLASLREVKAAAFSIPDSLVLNERAIESELGYTREKLADEKSKISPDHEYINILVNNELRLSEEKKKLTKLFEEKYPEFYAAKYNTNVASIDDVIKTIGKRGNYINYVFTENAIYTFIINKKHKAILTLDINTSLIDSISAFRNLLQAPVIAGGTRAAFNSYVSLGNYLYLQLFKPAEQFLISENIIISPDNVLTYLPFEALVKEKDFREDLLYRELDFLLRDYIISYTYSATMSVETSKDDRSLKNRAIAFAPEYEIPVDPANILNFRQGNLNHLADLPFARDEAEFVVSRIGGELYIKEDAMESVYKNRAKSFNILHLAMHTLINEDSPGYSKLIFSVTSEVDKEEGYLNTYEIYNTPLTAKMVVVSSCNTGSGKLRSGEGVMSLARGFVNAGSRSVVMSLWEVNDEMGTEVVKAFYNNLLDGQNKSKALRNAKLNFIDDASSSQLKGNPFYWATLVIYGNKGPLFFNFSLILFYFLTILIGITVVKEVISAVVARDVQQRARK